MNPSVKVAQPGWDAPTAPDWALVFNSDWPSLQIAYETTVTTGSNQVFPHGLGFPPLTMAWFTSGNSYGRVQSGTIEVDKTNIRLFPPFLGTYTIRAYNIDVSKDATYPLPTSAAAKTPPDLSTSIKVAKTGRGIHSPNMNDFILNSQAQSPAVLEIATEKGPYFQRSSTLWPYQSGTFNLIVYPLGTTYIPWNLGAGGLGSSTYQFISGQSVYYNQSMNALIFNVGAFGIGSLIVLRDPLFYPNTVRVVH